MNYLVTSISIFDGTKYLWEFETEFDAQTKVRELKDTGSNDFIVSLIELIASKQ